MQSLLPSESAELSSESYQGLTPSSFFAELKIPKFDVTEHVKKVDREFDPLLKSASELEAFSQKRQKEIQDEITQIDAEVVSPSSQVPLTLQGYIALKQLM